MTKTPDAGPTAAGPQIPVGDLGVVIPPRFKKALKKKPRDMQAAIVECINQLRINPRHPGLQVHKVKGSPGVWEAYVDKGNRLTFEFGDGCILLLNHCNHDMLRRA